MVETGARIEVLGAGTMGAGIAQCLADHGRDVTLTDIAADALARARQRIATSRTTLEDAGLQTSEASAEGDRRLATSTDLGQSVADADLVIYNYVCRGQAPGIERAAQSGKGVLVMKALGGQYLSCEQKNRDYWATADEE